MPDVTPSPELRRTPLSFNEASTVEPLARSYDHRLLNFAPPPGAVDYNPGARLLIPAVTGGPKVAALPVRRERMAGIPAAETVIFEIDGDLNRVGDLPLTKPGQIMGEDPRWVALADGTYVLWTVYARWPDGVTDATFTPRDLDRPAYLETVFYRGRSIGDLHEVGRCVRGNKGLVLTPDGFFYARPQKAIGHGTVAAGVFEDLLGLTEHTGHDDFHRAQPIGGGVFRDEPDGSATYGGIGDAWPVPDRPELHLLLAHDACSPNGVGHPDRRYRAVLLLHDLRDGEVYHLGVVATRDQWPATQAKIPGREDVVYHGGLFDLRVEADGHLTGAFTVGLSDAALGWTRFRTTVPFATITAAVPR